MSGRKFKDQRHFDAIRGASIAVDRCVEEYRGLKRRYEALVYAHAKLRGLSLRKRIFSWNKEVAACDNRFLESLQPEKQHG